MNALNKLSSYVQIHMIELDSFWKTNRLFINSKQFRQFLAAINYTVSSYELDILEKSLMNHEGQINIETLAKNVSVWKSKGDQMLEFIREKAFLVATESKKKFNQGRTVSAKNKKYDVQS